MKRMQRQRHGFAIFANEQPAAEPMANGWRSDWHQASRLQAPAEAVFN